MTCTYHVALGADEGLVGYYDIERIRREEEWEGELSRLEAKKRSHLDRIKFRPDHIISIVQSLAT